MDAAPPGQHYDVRLTAPDGYRAQRSYGLVPLDEGQIELTIDLLDDGEVSPYFHEVVQEGDQVELRGPFTSYFVWRGESPVLLVGGVRGGAADGDAAPPAPHDAGAGPAARVLRALPDDVIYADEIGHDALLTYTREAPDGWAATPATSTPSCCAASRRGAAGVRVRRNGFVETASELLVGLGMEPGNDPYGALRTHELTPGFRV